MLVANVLLAVGPITSTVFANKRVTLSEHICRNRNTTYCLVCTVNNRCTKPNHVSETYCRSCQRLTPSTSLTTILNRILFGINCLHFYCLESCLLSDLGDRTFSVPTNKSHVWKEWIRHTHHHINSTNIQRRSYSMT